MSRPTRRLALAFALSLPLALPLVPGAVAQHEHGSGAAGHEAGHQHGDASTSDLLDRLRAGGNVVFFRHERTDMLRQDDAEMSLDDCSTQRNLSLAGIASAREVGFNIRTLDLPIERIEASPMCRTLETARHAFGTVVANDRLMGFDNATGRTREMVGKDLRALVTEFAEPGTNAVFVAHFSNVSAAFGTDLKEGAAAVIAMEGGEPRVIGTLSAATWNDLVFDQVRAGAGHSHAGGHGAGGPGAHGATTPEAGAASGPAAEHNHDTSN